MTDDPYMSSNFDNPENAIKARNAELRESTDAFEKYGLSRINDEMPIYGAWEQPTTFGTITAERIEGRSEKVANLAMAIESLENALNETYSDGNFFKRWAELIERMTLELEAIMAEKE